MTPWSRRSEEYKLLTRSYSSSTHASDTGLGYDVSSPKRPRTSRLPAWSYFQRRSTLFWAIQNRISLSSRKRRTSYRILCYMFPAVLSFGVIIILLTALFQPSYTHLPRVGNNQADLQVRRRLSKIIQVKQAKPGV
jgi:hypothetical protein